MNRRGIDARHSPNLGGRSHRRVPALRRRQRPPADRNPGLASRAGRRACLSAFSLDFELHAPAGLPGGPDLRVDSITVDGRPATYQFVRPTYLGDPYGARFTVQVRYHGRPGVHHDGDGSREGWFHLPGGSAGYTEPIGAPATADFARSRGVG